MAVKKVFKKVGLEYFKTVSGMLTSAFGLVAALAWNELVKAVIDRYFSQGAGLRSHLIYALSVTILAVGVTGWLAWWAKRVDKEKEKNQ